MEAAVGIPAEYAITQAAHESRYGCSRLTTAANNFFGIKDVVRATVPRTAVEFETREFLGGQWISVKATFAKYRTVDDCFLDWGNYIVRRYPLAFAAAKRRDRAGFFNELQKGGYATDPRYASLLGSVYIDLYGGVA